MNSSSELDGDFEYLADCGDDGALRDVPLLSDLIFLNIYFCTIFFLNLSKKTFFLFIDTKS